MRKIAILYGVFIVFSVSIMGQNRLTDSIKNELMINFSKLKKNQILWNETIIDCKIRHVTVKDYHRPEENIEAYILKIPMELSENSSEIKTIEISLYLRGALHPSLSKPLCKFMRGANAPGCNSFFLIDSADLTKGVEYSSAGYLEIAKIYDSLGQEKKRINISKGAFIRSRPTSIFAFSLDDGTIFSGHMQRHYKCINPCTTKPPEEQKRLIRNIALFFLFASFVARTFFSK